MSSGAFLGNLVLNLCLVCGISYLMMHRIEKRLKAVRAEIQEMEDLVVALVDELQETAQSPPATTQPLPSPVEPTVRSAVLSVANLSPTFALPAPAFESDSIPNLPNPVSLPEPAHEPESIPAGVSKKPIHDPKHQKILDLWRQGHEIPEIARRLTMGPGEIRLVIGLYKQN